MLSLCAVQGRSLSNTSMQDTNPAEKQSDQPVGNGEDRDVSAPLWDLGILHNASCRFLPLIGIFQY